MALPFQSDEVIIDFRNGDAHGVSISEELAKMPVWKNLIRDESSPASSLRDSPKPNDCNRKRRRKHQRKKKEKTQQSLTPEESDKKDLIDRNEVSTLPAPWDLPYQSPPRTDLKFLTINDDDVNIDPACSRTESKTASHESSETNKSDVVSGSS